MTKLQRGFVGLLLLIALVAGGAALLKSGTYGFTIFVVAPVIIGALASWVVRPSTAKHAAGVGTLATLLATCSLLALGLEGLFCVLMALPLALPLGALGGWLAYRISSSRVATSAVAMVLLLPSASLIWDLTATPLLFEVRSAIEIAAPPEQVWKHVVTVSELPEPTEWFFRTGLAYPKRARIVGSGIGAVRYCDFSTGSFVEPIEVWDEPRLLRFAVTANPAPMHEWSPYAQVLPKHLHGYFISKGGQFRLTPLANHHTLLEGTSWYQHGLWPAEYWRWWSDAIIHRIHSRVLSHIRTLAEGDIETARLKSYGYHR
jgi:hypothetical protein